MSADRTKRLIAELAALDAGRWRTLVMEMSWAYRWVRAGAPRPLPEEAREWFVKLPPEEAWATLRGAVTALRRKHRRQAEAAQRRAKRAQRRSYMRGYMRDYRKGVRRRADVPRP